MNKELTLKEAEKIVDDMYQKRWVECGIEDGNTIHIGNLDKLQYTELESASILLLRTEISLQQENQKYKEVIDKAIKYLENNSLYEEEYDYDYEENSYLSGIDDETAKKDLLKILRGK